MAPTGACRYPSERGKRMGPQHHPTGSLQKPVSVVMGKMCVRLLRSHQGPRRRSSVTSAFARDLDSRSSQEMRKGCE